MSITKSAIKRASFLALVGSTFWLAACSTAFQNSRISGGYQGDHATEIVKEVSLATRLTPACFMLARSLTEASLKAKAAKWMPTAEYLADQEANAARHYEEGHCPTAAIPGLAFGVATLANSDERARVANRSIRWGS